MFWQLLNLTTRGPSQIAFPSEILSRVSTALSLAIFSVWHQRFLIGVWRSGQSDHIYWLPNLGQGLGHVRKMVTQRMNLCEFSNVIYIFGSYILITKPNILLLPFTASQEKHNDADYFQWSFNFFVCIFDKLTLQLAWNEHRILNAYMALGWHHVLFNYRDKT